MTRPIVYMIAGPNGAGKTTFSKEFLPYFENCREFVNADSIALGLSPFSPQSVNIQAGKLLLKRLRNLAKSRKTFGFETTLSGKTYVKFLKKLKGKGYEVRIYFLWLQNVELALKRVSDRVRKGGHNVPEHDVRRRYVSGLRNLFSLYRPLADFIAIIDNSTEAPKLLAVGDSKKYWSDKKQSIENLKRQMNFPADWKGEQS